MTKIEFPEQGDIIWLDAELHSGQEIGGHDPENENVRRPFLVVSSHDFNRSMQFVQTMPITHSQRMADGIMIPIVDPELGIDGMIIMYQLRGYDYVSRYGEIIGSARSNILKEALDLIPEIFDF